MAVKRVQKASMAAQSEQKTSCQVSSWLSATCQINRRLTPASISWRLASVAVSIFNWSQMDVLTDRQLSRDNHPVTSRPDVHRTSRWSTTGSLVSCTSPLQASGWHSRSYPVAWDKGWGPEPTCAPHRVQKETENIKWNRQSIIFGRMCLFLCACLNYILTLNFSTLVLFADPKNCS